MRVLVVCAHPDDETFGMGGTIAKHIAEGDDVRVCVLTDGVRARHLNVERQAEALHEAMDVLGVQFCWHPRLENQKLDVIPLLEVTKILEDMILPMFPADVVYTHNQSDTNQDHRRTFEAVQIVARPFPGTSIKKVVSFEIPSSTEWTLMRNPFVPNWFVDVTQFMERKIAALEPYTRTHVSEVKEFPHPRSFEAVRVAARQYAHSVGVEGYVERFEILRWVE